MAAPMAWGDADSAPFWAAAAEGKLIFQRCLSCGEAQFYPRPHCARCHGNKLRFETSSGRGTIHTFTIVHRAPTAAFKARVPYVIALVDLEEGFRLMVNLPGAEATAAAIGQAVRIVFPLVPEGSPPLPQAELVPGPGVGAQE